MRNTLAKLLSTAAVAGLGMAVVPQANAVILQFSGATTSDGGMVNGTFDYTAGVVTVISVGSTPGSQIGNIQTYASAATVFIDPAHWISFSGISNPGGSAQLGIFIVGATWAQLEAGTFTSATIQPSASPWTMPSNEAITLGVASLQRGITGGIINVVPEPSTYAMIAGLGMVAFGAYRRMSRKA